MRLSVLIPTYKRPRNIDAALTALRAQTRQPDQVIVVVREGDEETLAVTHHWNQSLSIDVVKVALPGVVEAVQRGIDSVSGDIVSITDDDAIPQQDWLMKIEQCFRRDARLGGLGGRDIVSLAGAMIPPRDVPVGMVCWYGRFLGNNHLGMGAPREVDLLKGVNMSFRTVALKNIRLDRDLRGKGAPSFEPSLSLAVKNAGWRLVYDPALLVNHYPATRPGFDLRDCLSQDAVEERSFNYYLTIRRYVQPAWKRAMALLWAKAIGLPYAPGWIRAIFAVFRRQSLNEFRASRRMWAEARSIAQRPRTP